jgi:hypothetical protein
VADASPAASWCIAIEPLLQLGAGAASVKGLLGAARERRCDSVLTGESGLRLASLRVDEIRTASVRGVSPAAEKKGDR